MAYLYHYHTVHSPKPGQIGQNDGSLECSLPIDTPERFQEAREAIAREIGLPVDGFNITSLTLLTPGG